MSKEIYICCEDDCKKYKEYKEIEAFDNYNDAKIWHRYKKLCFFKERTF